MSDNIPTVKIERKKAKKVKSVTTPAVVQTARYEAPKVQKAEAAMVCENDNMRQRAADRNMKNDMARVLILEEAGRSSNIIADVEVNCRDYFESQNSKAAQLVRAYTNVQTVASPTYIRQNSTYATSPAPKVAPLQKAKIVKASTSVIAADGYYYSIKRGDTLYRIARENCSSVSDISSLNGIADPTKIEVHQIIRLPAQKCNALK
ncbi:LysM peptidoglycan-binding domain-containing protein [Hellea balneolensis]|uniref:LysM peptidoglycan-binding domain-containing protein n=1 Tax=Hellea balneolensis TaxID=287478 RepID=UPI00040697A6|nr:LysM peptidoglycan-binding domain-containing protein [Hellea balneolensis]